MRRWFGFWCVIFYVGGAVGCTPITSRPQLEPTVTILSLPTRAILPTLTPTIETLDTPSQEEPATPTIAAVLEAPQPAAETPTAEKAAAEEAAIIVFAGDSEVYQIKIGQTFTFQGPRGPGWQIGYDQNLLTLLTPVEMVEQPGDDWVFQAKQETGRTRIWVSNAPPPCEGEICPPSAGAEMQMEALIEIVNE